MSIQREVNRITNEVNTQSDLITQIKNVLATKAGGGGGGLPTGITALATGEYTPTADQTCPITIPHGMSVTPNVVVLTLADDTTTSAFAGYLLFYASVKLTVNTYVGAYIARYVLANGSIGTTGGNFSTMADIATETDIKISGTRVLKGGHTYRWVAVAVDGL